jgi:hypothetical protein
MNSDIRFIDASAIAAIRGMSNTEQVEKDHAVVAMDC